MKKISVLISLISISLCGFGQKVDTLKIDSGKPYAFLISVAEYPTQLVGDNLEEEKQELEKNFKDNNLNIILIKKHCFLKLKSGQGLDMTDLEKPYTATAYWSGDIHDEIEVYDQIVNTTAFISEKMGLEKESSYTIKSRTSNEEVRQLLAKNNITNNSKSTLSKYLQMYHNPILTENEEYWFSQDIPKIKMIKIFVTDEGKEGIYKLYEFNPLGQISFEANYNSKGQKTNKRKYIYENDMLTQIEKEDRTISINYDDNKMILSENVGEANETTIFWIEQNNLLSKRYLIMNDGNYSNQNMIIEDKIVDNCIFSYSNEKIISKQCSSIYGSFPYFHSYTSYQSAAANQESEFMQLIKYKIEKKGDQIFEKYYSEAQKPEDKDKYILKSTLYLNEHNLISKLISGKDLIKVEYIYYP